jgi:lipoate-protein ligase A
LVHDEPTAAAQMAFDEGLVAEGIPTLRLFRWHAPAISVGYRQRLPGWADPARLRSSGVEWVERPTGGGIAVHGSDLSCAMVVPRHPSLRLRVVMEQTCEHFARVCRSVGVDAQWRVEMPRSSPVVYCLTEPSPYALTVSGRKLCGFAVRAYTAAWLIQGSLLVQPLPEAIRAVMPASVRFDYETRAVCLEQAAGMAIADETLVNGVTHALRHV